MRVLAKMRNKSISLCFALLTLFISICNHVVAQANTQETITIAIHDYPPFNDKAGGGLVADIYRAAFSEVDMAIEFRVYPIKRGIQELLSGRVDAHSPGHAFIQGDNEKKINWTPTFTVFVVWAFYKPNQKRIQFTNLTDLRGYRLGVITNSAKLEHYIQHGLDIYPVQTPEKLIKMTKAKRFDYFETASLSSYLLVKNTFPDEWSNFDSIPWDSVQASLAFLKDDPKSQHNKQLFDKGFDAIKRNGKYMQILETYWGKNNVPKDVLLDDLKQFGVEKVNAKLFHSYKRDENGKIIP